MGYRRIVVGTDGSAHARRAEDAGISLAAAHKATLLIATGIEEAPVAEAVLSAAMERAAGAGVKARSHTFLGPPASGLLTYADAEKAELIVLGSRGLGKAKRLVMGSVSSRVAHHAPCDVLVVKQGIDGDACYRRVVLATDGSATADRAARKAYEFARKAKAGITLVFVGHPATGDLVLADTHETLDWGSAQVEFEIVPDGDPASRICEAASGRGADVIVVGNRGMNGKARIVLGSVPTRVLEQGGCDVLIARTTVQALSEIEKGQGGIVKIGDRKLAIYRDDDGTVIALSAKCTHMGCTVGWNETERTWDCPCHGSRFACTGEVLEGPATHPLERTDA